MPRSIRLLTSGKGLAGLFAGGLVALVALPAPASANDSTARMEMGGLVYTASAEIRMAEEDLEVSTKEVRVRYRFENTSDKDITTLVAFPMPPMVIGEGTNYSIPGTDPVNFIDFSATVDGEPVAVLADVKATRFGVDVTDILARHGIPATLVGDEDETKMLWDRLNTLPQEDRRDLIDYGLVDWTGAFGANDMPLATAHWTAHVAYYWMQTFPAGKSVFVEHSYRPVTGAFFLTKGELDDPGFRAKYCIDDDFARAVKRRMGAAGQEYLLAYDLGYVLLTAGNWYGPIGRFSLTVDKGKRKNLVSLCVDGIDKIGPTTFLHEARDFSPAKNLDVLFVEAR